MMRETIGCSELGALFGADPRCTPRHLYLRLTGQVDDRPTTAPMLVGQTFEPAIAGWYLERHPGYQWDFAFARREDPPMVRGRLHGHPDGLITVAGASSPTVNGEIKIPLHDRYSWASGVPLWYQWQAQGQMALSGFDACVAVECVDLELRGDEVVRIHCREHLVERDERVHRAIDERTEAFFRDHVIPGVPPPATGGDYEELCRVEPRPYSDEPIALDDNLTSHASVWRTIRGEMRELEARARKLDKEAREHAAIVIDAMGTAERARMEDGTVLLRKRQERRGHVVQPSVTYSLKIERQNR